MVGPFHIAQMVSAVILRTPAHNFQPCCSTYSRRRTDGGGDAKVDEAPALRLEHEHAVVCRQARGVLN